MVRRISIFGWFCGVALLSAPAFAQTAPDTSVAAALGSLSARSGVVFAGDVIAVRHVGGVVEVEFQIEQGLKGAVSGSYMLREWAGLWAAGQRRYWVGERAVVFLHEAGKSGLSSSVDGMDGILPILAVGDVSAGLSVDVERLRARVLRAAGAPMAESAAQMSLAAVALAVQGASGGVPVPGPMPLPVRALPTHVVPVLRPLLPDAEGQTYEAQHILRAPETHIVPEAINADH
jgi:hypothetical protein